MQWVVEIKLADKSIAYVSQKFCSGDDVIAQGPSLGRLPGFDYRGSDSENLTVQFRFCSAFWFSFFLAQNTFSHCYLGQAE